MRSTSLNAQWELTDQPAFLLGIGLSTGLVAAALLGSEERLEYTVVGDTVNLTQRLQQWADPGETVLSEPTWAAIGAKPDADQARTGDGQGPRHRGRCLPVSSEGRMTLVRIEVSDTVRRRIGQWFAGISVGLSLFGLMVLAALWGWSGLVRTDAVYFGVLGLGFGALTWILVRAQSDNGAVWAIAWSALFSSLFTAGLATAVLLSRGAFPGLTLDELRELSPAMLPRPAAFALHFRFWAVVPALWLALTFGLLLFPDGRLPTPRWRWVGWLSIVAIAVATVASAVVHNPWSTRPVKAAEDSVDSFGGALIDLAFLVSSLMAVLCAASLVVRYRRAAGPTRGQIRWVGFGGAVFIAALVAGGSLDSTVGDGLVGELIGIGAFLALMVCWGVAVTRYRLYEIDVVISKSVTYLGLAAAIAGLYASGRDGAAAGDRTVGRWRPGPGVADRGRGRGRRAVRADQVADAALGQSVGLRRPCEPTRRAVAGHLESVGYDCRQRHRRSRPAARPGNRGRAGGRLAPQ